MWKALKSGISLILLTTTTHWNPTAADAHTSTQPIGPRIRAIEFLLEYFRRAPYPAP
jgi:hypothetical protein